MTDSSHKKHRTRRWGIWLLVTAAVLCQAGYWVTRPQSPRTTKTLELKCTLSADKSAYTVGEVPEISVRLKNPSHRALPMAGSLDGSDCLMRFPYCYFEITGPDGRRVDKGTIRCGSMVPLRQEDFVLVKPGEEFDPYDTSKGYYPSYQISKETFDRPGAYRLVFVYRAQSWKMVEWLGDGIWDWEKNKDERLRRLIKEATPFYAKSNKLVLTFSK